jgi:transketolase
VSLAATAHAKLTADGVRARVVSMPSCDIFERETQAYRDSVLPPAVAARIAIEQASTFGLGALCRRAGKGHRDRDVWRLRAAKALQQEIGFSVDNVVARAKALLQAHGT